MAFVPRLNSNGLLTLKYWGSQNPYVPGGFGLPNCTCYSFGRVWEYSGEFPQNLTPGHAYGNARDWYPAAVAQNIPHGQTPKLGAVICYNNVDGGHVAVVEKIFADGSILLSNSGYTRDPSQYDRLLFYLDPADKSSGVLTPANNYTANPGYNTFQGFIYPAGEDYSGFKWYAKKYQGYERNSAEAYNNAVLMYQVFSSLGFTLNAVAGILGNVEQESGYNPWQWEGDEIRSSTDYIYAPSTRCGYGLFQFTPCYDYIGQNVAESYDTYAPNFSDRKGKPEDGDAQCRFADYHAPRGQWLPSQVFPEYNLTWEQFKSSTQAPEYLARAWCWQYERPRTDAANIPVRESAARYWYDKLQNITPTDPLPDPPDEQPEEKKKRKMPFWFYTLRPYFTF